MKISAEQTIDVTRFGNSELIEARVSAAPEDRKDALRATLSYLYLTDGPTNLPRERLRPAERLLESAERIVVRWLHTRTNGRLSKHYGRNSLLAARKAQYQCESCGFADVRVLNLDQVDGRDSDSGEFVCLCANCHGIRSRANDWELPPLTADSAATDDSGAPSGTNGEANGSEG